MLRTALQIRLDEILREGHSLRPLTYYALTVSCLLPSGQISKSDPRRTTSRPAFPSTSMLLSTAAR